MKFAAVAAALALTVVGAAAAHATTYTGAESFDGATVDVSFTTDGTLGTLTSANFTAFNVDVSDPSGSVDMTNLNSGLAVFGSALSATATDLQFDFTQGFGNQFLVEQSSIGDNGPYWCATDGGCYPNESAPAIGVSTVYGESPNEQVSEAGLVTIASTISAAPEPSTWLLLLTGVFSIGMMLRRDKFSARYRFRNASAG